MTLYPAMPYPSYAHLTGADIVAMYAYFTHGVSPVRAQNRRNEIPWPLSMRWPLTIWRKTFAPNPDASRSMPRATRTRASPAAPTWCRGRAIAEVVIRLEPSRCRRRLWTSRQILSWRRTGDRRLVGGQSARQPRGWPRGWSSEQIIATLRSARDPVHAVIGDAMSDVVVHSTQYLNDADLLALASYLKTLSPDAHPASSFAADPGTARAMAAGEEAGRGAQLYDDNCAACHHSDGRGATRALPAIAGNSSVLAADPTSIIHLILQGSQLPGTAAAPSPLGMPGFGWRMSDQEVAELGTFIRQSWGNHAPAINPEQVHHLRQTLAR